MGSCGTCMRVSTLLRKARRDARLSGAGMVGDLSLFEHVRSAPKCVRCGARSLARSFAFFHGACLAGQGVVFLFRGNDYFARGKLYRGNHKYLPGSQKFQK